MSPRNPQIRVEYFPFKLPPAPSETINGKSTMMQNAS
jgi:hypothetical protein